MTRTIRAFSAVKTEGGLLPQDLLSRIQSGDPELPGTSAKSYNLAANERIGEAANRAWSRLVTIWHVFQEALEKEPEDSPATGLTRERWLLPLFQELGYGRLPKGSTLEVEGKSFAISHTWNHSPIHLLGCRVDLDRRQKGVAGAARSSPHGLVQEFLNRSDDHLWGFVTNGYRLRVLRDHHSLTRQAYVEFDLQTIMEGEQYSEFLLFWLVCHQSRVEAEQPEDCWLEAWVNTSRDEGVRALDKLRDGVEMAIEALGTGFLSHSGNTALREALETGSLDKQDYYRQLLRLVYRLIFLFVAEERDALLDPDAPDEARERYRRWYDTHRLRVLAEKRRGSPHGDVWRALALVMEKLYGGYPELGLPALGSRLWGPAACPTLMQAECANEHMLTAIRHLSHIQEGTTRYPVNWRNIGADELGSIYEGLLELHPRVNREAGTFSLDTAAGHERKTTGSYYTPTALVDCLLEASLDPLLDEACRGSSPERAILDLKVCDPACGSGHFLVAAARRIAGRLAAVRSGDDEPSPIEVQHALRDVVGRCVYGVDLNPMAVELCKVSLWMEAIEPGRPLSFLDGHIQCGHALFGTQPDLLEKGLPHDAWTALKGEDKAVAQRLKKANKEDWRQRHFDDELGELPQEAQILESARKLEKADDSTVAAVEQKEELWREVSESPTSSHARLIADLWCAAFVWPKNSAEAEGAAPVRRIWEVVRRDASKLPAKTKAILDDLRERFVFFHWHLGFPTVMERGGFDLILGNPPWDTLSPDRREFFSQYQPGMRSLAPKQQDAVIEELLEDPKTADAWEHNQLELFGLVHFLKKSGRFTLYAKGNLGKGDFNVYRMFAELALRYVRTDGFAAQVVPANFYGGANASAIRHHVLDNCRLRLLLGCENKGAKFFPGVHPQTWFAVYSAQIGGRSDRFLLSFGATAPDQVEERKASALQMSADTVRKAAPNTYAIPEVHSAADITVSEKMVNAHPAFGDESAGPPRRHYQREVDMGNDSDRFTTDPLGLPLYEGRMISHFDHRAKTYDSGHGNSSKWIERPFGDPEKAIVPQWRVMPDMVPGKLGDRCDRFRIGFGDVSNPRNERSVTTTLIPPGVICGHTVPTIIFDEKLEWAYLPWLAVANSFAMDWFARRKLSSPHLTYTVMDSLPFPRPAIDEPWVQQAAPLVLRLVCTTPEMKPFWNRMAAQGLCEATADGPVPAEVLVVESERAQARAELEAIVAHEVYGLTREELEDVLETFPVLKKRDIEAFGDYRTKLQILEAFDDLQREQPQAAPSATSSSQVQPPGPGLAKSAPESSGGGG